MDFKKIAPHLIPHLIPHKSLTRSLTFYILCWAISEGWCEGYVRDKNILSHPSSPLYKGVSRDYVRVEGFLLNTTKKSAARGKPAALCCFWSDLVPRPGIEPGWVAPLVFETSASTDSAIWAWHFKLFHLLKRVQRYYFYLNWQKKIKKNLEFLARITYYSYLCG